MATLGDIVINLKANTTQFSRGTGLARKELGGVDRATRRNNNSLGRLSAQFGAAGGSARVSAAAFLSAKNALIGLVAAAGGLSLKGMIGLAADAEVAQVQFSTLLDSGERARKMLADLQKFAASTPFQLPELRDAAKTLIAFNEPAGDVLSTLEKLGNISALSGKGLNELAVMFGKARANQRLFADDVTRFVEAGIPLLDVIGEKFGTTGAETRKMIEAGKADFGLLVEAIDRANGAGGKFAGGMAKQSKTLSGLWSTLKDNIAEQAKGIGQDLVEALNLKRVVSAMTTSVQFIGNALHSLRPVIERIGKVVNTVFDDIERRLDNLAKNFRLTQQYIIDFRLSQIDDPQLREATRGAINTAMNVRDRAMERRRASALDVTDKAAFELTGAEQKGDRIDARLNGLVELTRRQSALIKARREGAIAEDDYAKAMRATVEARDKLTGGSGKLAETLQTELELLGKSATQQEYLNALRNGARVDDANRVAGLRAEIAAGNEMLKLQQELAELQFGKKTVDAATRLGVSLDQVGQFAAGDFMGVGLDPKKMQQLAAKQNQINEQNQLKADRDRATELKNQFADPADTLRKQVDELRRLAGAKLIDPETLKRGLAELESQFGPTDRSVDASQGDRAAAEVRTGEAFSRVLAAMRQPSQNPELKEQQTTNKKLDQQLNVLRDVRAKLEQNDSELIA